MILRVEAFLGGKDKPQGNSDSNQLTYVRLTMLWGFNGLQLTNHTLCTTPYHIYCCLSYTYFTTETTRFPVCAAAPCLTHWH